MKLKNFLYVFCLIVCGNFAISGCDQKESAKIVWNDGFQINMQKNHQSKPWFANYCVNDMVVLDTVLLVTDDCNEQVCYFYGVQSGRLLAARSRKGKGPGEVIYAPCIFNSELKIKDKTYFFLWDQITRRLSQYDLAEAILSEPLRPYKWFPFPKKLGNPELIFLDDSTLIGTSNDDHGNLFIFDWRKDSVTHWTPRINVRNPEHPDNKNKTSYEHIAFSKDNNKIVGSFQYLKRLHIYSINGDLETIIQDRKESVLPNFAEHNKPKEVNLAYSKPLLTKHYIYVIFYNCNIAESGQRNSELHVFNYEGKAIARFMLDQPLSRFCIDERNNMLLCIPYNSPDSLITYDLNFK